MMLVDQVVMEVAALLPPLHCCMLCGCRRVSVVHDAVAVKEPGLLCLAVVFTFSPVFAFLFRNCLAPAAGR